MESVMRLVGDYPRHGTKEVGDKAAIIGDSGTLTYRELDRLSDCVAAFLRREGYAPGTRIAHVGKNSELMFPVFFGCIRAGCVFVPLNWRYAAQELEYVLRDSQARLLVYGSEVEPTVRAASVNCAGLRLLAERPSSGAQDLLACLAGLTPEADPPAATRTDECVLQLYTSGTTGRPKGVMLSHAAISTARWVEMDSPHWADWSRDDVVLSAMPNFHAGGLSWMLIGLLRETSCVLTADPSPGNLLALSYRYRATRTFAVPTVVKAMIDEIEKSGAAPPPLRTIYYGAAPMNSELLLRCLRVLPDCGFAQYYGMTEAAGAVTFMAPNEHDPGDVVRLRSVGRALPGYQVVIRDTEGRATPAGVPGELWVRSPTLMLGYWQQPEATADVLVDGWYRTGDGGYVDHDGYVFLTDRIKDLIISGGENVYPIEVENALRTHPAVLDAVAIGVPDDKWGETVCAVVEWRPGQSATLEQLREHCRSQIAAFKLPRHLRAVAQLPRTATGKLQRAEVRRSFSAGLI